MLVKSKEIIPPGGIHKIEYKGPQLSPGQTWDDNPLPLKRDSSQELMLKNRGKTKTVFDPAVYDPNAIRAGMDDALSKGLTPNLDKKITLKV